ncbi:carbon monoxide dehydrogenase [Candidatus Poribacteria bacterium]|nr:carbon monoxide dehydrogenase [Candidatus Poribacteria bacterium]
MKLAITGKGGVGKTTLSAALAQLYARDGSRVIAVDADPDTNLAATLGFPDPDSITPVFEMGDLIAERTGAKPGAMGSYFTLNPKVDDIPDDFCPEHDGVRLLTIGGAAREGGSGCFCPESAFLRALMAHLLFGRDDVAILDMEAGVEHLTRGTAQGVDALIVAVEPGRRSIETARRIRGLAGDLGIGRVWAVASKTRGDEDREFVASELGDVELIASIPYSAEIVENGMRNAGVGELLDGPLREPMRDLRARLEGELR